MKWSAVTALSVAALGVGSAEQADLDIAHCPAHFDKLLGDNIFSRYPARVPPAAVRPVAPDVRNGKPHLYRTVIREEATEGPNFAGHYTVIRIGCGAATVCLAIADARTGNVYFPPALEEAEALLVNTGGTRAETLNYKKYSRLLITVGTLNENRKTEGMSYFVWQRDKLTLIRFVPKTKLCERG